MYSPAINCGAAPGTSVFPSTAYVCEISVTVNTAPAAVNIAISVPVTGALELVTVVLFTCVKVLWTGGEAALLRNRRSSCQLLLSLMSPCSPLVSALAISCRLSSTSSPRAVGCGLASGIPIARSGRVGAALFNVAATAVEGCELVSYS